MVQGTFSVGERLLSRFHSVGICLLQALEDNRSLDFDSLRLIVNHNTDLVEVAVRFDCMWAFEEYFFDHNSRSPDQVRYRLQADSSCLVNAPGLCEKRCTRISLQY